MSLRIEHGLRLLCFRVTVEIAFVNNFSCLQMRFSFRKKIIQKVVVKNKVTKATIQLFSVRINIIYFL